MASLLDAARVRRHGGEVVVWARHLARRGGVVVLDVAPVGVAEVDVLVPVARIRLAAVAAAAAAAAPAAAAIVVAELLLGGNCPTGGHCGMAFQAR